MPANWELDTVLWDAVQGDKAPTVVNFAQRDENGGSIALARRVF